MTWSVRAAQPADLPAILPMMVAFNHEESIAWSPKTGQAALVRLLSSPELGHVGLGIHDAAPAGYFILTWGFDLEWSGRDAFLTELFLSPAARGRGLGKRLLAAAVETAQENGVRALHLVVRPQNAAAVALYRQAGFQDVPRTLMTKKLA
jgi:ribosomal protein S18 acetylase RimI-like enzyme